MDRIHGTVVYLVNSPS